MCQCIAVGDENEYLSCFFVLGGFICSELCNESSYLRYICYECVYVFIICRLGMEVNLRGS